MLLLRIHDECEWSIAVGVIMYIGIDDQVDDGGVTPSIFEFGVTFTSEGDVKIFEWTTMFITFSS